MKKSFSLLLLWLGGIVAGFAQNPLDTRPGTPVNSSAPSLAKPGSLDTSTSILSGLLNLEFSDHHLTPRGINLQERGLVTQQKLLLFWQLYAPDFRRCPVDAVTLTTGVWNDIDTMRSGVRLSSWNEIDPSVGLNVKFLHDWVIESPFTAFMSESHSYPTTWNWNPRLTYHDHIIPNFSFNAYVEFFDELYNKSTVVFDSSKTQSGYYGILGFDPTYVFQGIPLKIELPTYILLPSDTFYQRSNGERGGSGLGLISTLLKATVPLEFIPKSCGVWSIYAGVQYDYLNNPGLLDGNQLLTRSPVRDRDVIQYHAGLTVRF